MASFMRVCVARWSLRSTASAAGTDRRRRHRRGSTGPPSPGWINDYRFYEQGKSPLESLPKGRRSSSSDCPLAKATGLLVDGTHLVNPLHPVSRYHEAIASDLPWFVRQFADDFDAGKYPELEEHG